jgi:hypothetical protein
MTAALADCYADNRFRRSVDVWDIMERLIVQGSKDVLHRKFMICVSMAVEGEAVSGSGISRHWTAMAWLLPGLACDFCWQAFLPVILVAMTPAANAL